MENDRKQEEVPFFSVIMTTYNREALMDRALQSLVEQTETDWEALIIDDGSTDATEQRVQKYLQKYPKIHYQYQENRGFIAGKNAGIRLANGKYITFLDSDDEYEKTHLATRKEILLKEQQIDLLHGGVKIIGSEFVPDANNPSQKIHLTACAISGTFFIKRRAMQRLDKFAGNELTTDADFMKRALKNNLSIVKTDIPTYIYHRDLESSITLDMWNKKNKNKS